VGQAIVLGGLPSWSTARTFPRRARARPPLAFWYFGIIHRENTHAN